ncbi:hypothetical protein H0H92_011462 [Tricholoma furcatifolium]|nr:hypothetical protein H0H92_011462 [Tricholoma furcatifolium]
MPACARKNVHGRTSKNTPARNKQASEPATPAVLAPPSPVVTSARPQFVPSKAYDFTALAVASSDTHSAFEQLGVQHDRLIADCSSDAPTPSRPHVESHPAFSPPHTLSVSPPPSPTPIAPTELSSYSTVIPIIPVIKPILRRQTVPVYRVQG